MPSRETFFKKIIVFLLRIRLKFIPDRIFLILVSVVVGLLSGLVAVVLKTSVHYFQNALRALFNSGYNTYLYVFFPVIGLLCSTYYVQKFRKGRLQRGIANVLLEITKKKGIVAGHKLFSQLISSFFTLGFGGSAGLEAPISVTGSAIGSRLALALRISERQRKLLVGCGAAGGIAAIFNSPIAGVLFAVEIILSEMTIPAFVPLIISSASAVVISKLLYTGQPFKLITNEWQLNALGYYIVLGLLCSIISVYMIRVYYYISEYAAKITRPYLKALVGGLALGLMIFILPPLFGEGYNIVVFLLDGKYTQLLNDSLFWQYKNNITVLLIFSFVVMLLKVFATSVTVSSGGNGGMFGSSLFVGALLGFVYSKLINLSGFHNISEVNFIVVAMAGILAGVIHAPLTAIFLIAEITGGYALFVPLMVVVSLSYFIARYFEPYSAYTKGIAESGEYIQDNRDMLVLENLNLGELIETNFITLNEKDPFYKLVDAIEKSRRNIFPVVDDKNHLTGIVLLDDIREIIFNRELYSLVLVQDVMAEPPAVIDVEKDKLYYILKKLDELNVWNLPAVKDGVYLGFISKANILNHYRNLLIRQTRHTGW